MEVYLLVTSHSLPEMASANFTIFPGDVGAYEDTTQRLNFYPRTPSP